MEELLKDADVVHHCMNDLSKAVDVLPVHMDGDHRLKARQVFFRKLPGDLQGQLRRDLPWRNCSKTPTWSTTA